ncbi:MAG: hypothetical protein ABL973_18140 [Micropepsaceae bacterium]
MGKVSHLPTAIAIYRYVDWKHSETRDRAGATCIEINCWQAEYFVVITDGFAPLFVRGAAVFGLSIHGSGLALTPVGKVAGR